MLHIVLPVHNRADVTVGFLRSLTAQTVSDYHLVLVDDGCTDDTVARAREIVPPGRLIVLHGDGSLWWAGALQRAYEHLRAGALSVDDEVLIINDDTRFAPDFLAAGLAVLAEHPGSAVQAVGVDESTGIVDNGAVADLILLRFRAAAPGEAPNCLSTRGLLMRAQTFVDSGGFRPRWLPHYLSDYEYTLRLRRHGVALRCDPRFWATVRLELTGADRYPAREVRRVWSSALSNRAKFNPKHWSAFVLMACPASVVPMHLARIWLRFAWALLVAARWARRTNR